MPESDPAPGRERPAAARRSTGKATTTKAAAKAPVKKSAARKSAAKKTPAKKTPARKTSTKKTSTKKSAAKESAAKESAAKKSPAKKSPAKKSPAKKTPAKEASPRRRTGRATLPVRPRESPWTKQDIAAVRGELEDDRSRLLDEVTAAEQEIKVLLRDGGDGAGNDQADVGSKALERDAEMSLANNSREMLIQVERALARLDDGTYGVCESCGQPIGKLRLMAFPRATLCLSCKQRQERR
ncbi:MAG: TraR/DksA C4-type zinc finger protein [Nocardioidaceae bacterium]|nr:TraR/DksA C4-type zinc finger protein [Nocardioidaceae bacterium]